MHRLFLYSLTILLTALVSLSCQEEPTVTSPPSNPMQKRVKKNTGSYTGQVIEKTSLNKAGKPLESADLFFRLSMGDYFIKFCESSISRSDLADQVDGYITVKGTVKKGEWDTCPGDPPGVQSRVGEYFVITELLK